MPRKKKNQIKEDDDITPTCPFWMLTFGDAMSLLLTFFVMLVSFTSFDKLKMGGFIGSLALRFGGMGFSGRGTGLEKVDRLISILVRNRRALTFREKERVLKQIVKMKGYIRSQGEYGYIQISKVYRGYSIRIGNDLLFKKGSDKLTERAKKILSAVIPLLIYVDNPIVIEGHTDNIPLRYGGQFKDNFDLSFSRALAVTKFLIKGGIEEKRISVAGLGDLRPVAPNDTPENRMKNRRVEIIIVGRTPDFTHI